MKRIAISYRRADSSAISRAIFDRLTQHYGSESVFMDIDRIPFGENFHSYIVQELEKTDVLLAVVGPRWRGSRKSQPPRIYDADDPVRVEIETAAATGTFVLPVLVAHARMPSKNDLPKGLEWFAELNAAHVDEARDFDSHIAALIDAIDERTSRTRRSRFGEIAPNNLPHLLSTFVGRKNELKHLQSLLHGKRLVSIVGPGGVGKTRLAIQLAQSVLRQFPGGAWFVPVSKTFTGDVAAAVANAMALDIAGRDPLQTLLQYVDTDETLLVFDDSELYLEGVAAFASEILGLSSHVRLLITSRERLRVSGEQIYELAPLRLPRENMPLSEARRCDAMRLLLDRAKTNDDSFKVDESNLTDLVKICERLDGVPLALEFAAARFRTLSPNQIVKRLDEQFALLVSDRREEGRHRTLQAAIEWSYNLLDECERLLFARLAVFRGAFGIGALEAICADEHVASGSILELVTSLVEKSFVTRTGLEENTAFRLLHVIRSYALERLGGTPDRFALEKRHFLYFARKIESFDGAEAQSRFQVTDELVHILPDVVAALEWAVEQKLDRSVTLALSLAPFWAARRFYREGADILESTARANIAADGERGLLLARASSLRDHLGETDVALSDAKEALRLLEEQPQEKGLAYALFALGAVVINTGKYDEGLSLTTRALSLLRNGSDDAVVARCLINVSICEAALRRYEAARRFAREAIELCERTGNPAALLWAHAALGTIEYRSGNFALARSEYELWLAIARSIEDYSAITTALAHLAEVELLAGNQDEAQRNLNECMAIIRQQNFSAELPFVLETIAQLVAQRSDDDNAAKLLGSADALRLRMKFPLNDTEQDARAGVIRAIVSRHSTQWFEEEHARGAALNAGAVLTLALRAVHFQHVGESISTSR